MPDLIQAADVFVLPSLMEGLCSTLVDVMLARRPIVASRVGGVPEVLGATAGDPEVGRLIAPGDPQALASAVIETIGKLGQLDDQLERASQRAWRRFTAERMIDETLAVYQEVLAARRAA